MRRSLIIANWKMHKSVEQAVNFVADLLPRLAELGVEGAGIDATGGPEVALAAPFTALADLRRALGGSGVALAAQNVHDQREGPFTGEISAPMLVELDCSYALVGHSERRHGCGESSGAVAAKARALLDLGIRPVVCVGETAEQREAGRAREVVAAQLTESLGRVARSEAESAVVAYEPVWAIGTGRHATPDIAQEIHAAIRTQLRELFGSAAEAMRIQYGGSVTADNAAALAACPDIDGALVGGASLDARSFAAVVAAVGNR